MGFRSWLQKTIGPSQPVEPAASAEIGRQAQTGSPFSPGLPLRPFDGVSSEPRQWDLPTGYNIRTRADRDGRLSFDDLKAVTDTYDVAAACIRHRINDLRSMDWSIVPKPGLLSDVDDLVEAGRKIMAHPDGVHTYRSWIAMFLEDVLRYDAGALYRRRNRAGQVIGLEVVSGRTVAPILDYWGRRPAAPAPAFEQFVNGLPWKQLTTDDLIYEPLNPQSDSPYGRAPIESAILNANVDLRMQQYFLDRFTKGSIPGGFMTTPPGWTPDQVLEYEDRWNAVNTGDQAAKHQMRALPNGSATSFPNLPQFDQDIALFFMHKTCAAFDVTPTDLGFTETVNRATSDTQQDVQYRIGSKPLVQYVQDIVTTALQEDFGLPVEFQIDTGQESEDRLNTAQADQIYAGLGVISPDEIRQRVFGLPVDAEHPVPRLFVLKAGVITLDQVMAASGAESPVTGAPATEEDPGLPPEVVSNPPQAAITPTGALSTKPAPVAASREAITKALRLWHRNTTSRINRGQAPKRFESADLPDEVRDLVWKSLDGVRSREQADRVFGAVMRPLRKSWRDPPVNPQPQHDRDLPLVDWWGPKIRDGLRGLWSSADLRGAVEAAQSVVGKSSDDVTRQLIREATAQFLGQRMSPDALQRAVSQMWADAYSAGGQAAEKQIGLDVPGWDDWTPGSPDAAALAEDGGWQAAIAARGQTVQGMTDTQMRQIGDAIADGLADGDSVDTIADALDGVASDSRALMIADTEVAAMMTAATMSTYQANGIDQWDLVTADDPCDDCQAMADDNPHQVGDDQPPIHPFCRCCASPHVEDDSTDDESGDGSDDSGDDTGDDGD